MRVLLIYTELEFMVRLMESFEQLGHVVVQTRSIEEGSDWLMDDGLDVVLGEVPVSVDQEEVFFEQLRQQERLARLPLLLMGGNFERPRVQRYLQHGADAYLWQPFVEEEVLAVAHYYAQNN